MPIITIAGTPIDFPSSGREPNWADAVIQFAQATADTLFDGIDGPDTATDNAIVRFNGITGKIAQNSTVTIADTTGAMAFTAATGAHLTWTTNGAGNIGTSLAAGSPANIYATTSILSPYFSTGTANVATTGQVRLAYQEIIGWRNSTNDANLTLSADEDFFKFTGGQVGIINGSVSAPGLRFISDSQAGLYFNEGAWLSFNEGGRIGVTSTGVNVPGLTASYAVVTDGSKNLASLAYTSANTASTLVQRDDSGNFSMSALTATTGTFSSTLGVTGASTLAALSATTGTFSSTLGVTGASTLAALTATTGAFSSTVSMTGLTATTGAFSSTLAVTGASTLTGNITLNAATTVAQSFVREVGDGSTEISGGTSVGSGGTLKLYGATHETKASWLELVQGGTARVTINSGSAASTTVPWTFSMATASTSPSTGAVIVSAGGLGVSGAGFFGGALNSRISASGTLGPYLFLHNSAASALGNTSSVIFGNNSGAGTTTSAKISVINTNAGNGADRMVFSTHSGGGVITEAMSISSTQDVSFSRGTSPGEIRFLEGSGGGTNYIGFKAPAAVTTSLVYELPTADGSDGQVLATDGAGVMSWVDVSSTAESGELILHTGNGHGSTNTKIRRFTTIEANTGTQYTYADSATNGMSVTIDETGFYAIDYTDVDSAAPSQLGISVNSAQLTTNIGSITAANRKAYAAVPTGDQTSVSIVIKLTAGDVVRAHTNGSTIVAFAVSRFSIRKISGV